MNERIVFYKDKILGFWQRFSTRQKILLGASAALLVLALILFIQFSSKPDFQVLYPNLEQAEAGEVVAKLKEKGIPYELSANGSTISIPKVHVSEVLVEFAQQGIPSTGDIDASIFQENMTFGMTDAQFDVIERSAIEGELRKLIKTIEGVNEASVMITLPPKDVFWSETDQHSTASVIVHLAPGNRLKPEQINGLYLLVSKAVPNLAAEDITISDQNMNILEANGDRAGESIGPVYLEQRQIQKDFQKDIQRDVQMMLGRILGPDKVVVQVYANLNFDQKQRQEERVEPVTDEEGIEISVERIQESYSGNSAPVGGTPNTASDINGYPNTASTGDSESERSEERVNYEVNRISENIVSQPFAVEDLTINVGIEPPVANDPESLTNEATQAVQSILANIVRSALASTGEITDQDILNKITVFPHEFRGNVAIEEKNGFANPFAWIGVGALAILVIGGAVWLISKRKRNDEDEIEAQVPVFNPQSLEIETAVSEEMMVRKQLENLAKKRPEEFAKLLRTWLADE